MKEFTIQQSFQVAQEWTERKVLEQITTISIFPNYLFPSVLHHPALLGHNNQQTTILCDSECGTHAKGNQKNHCKM